MVQSGGQNFLRPRPRPVPHPACALGGVLPCENWEPVQIKQPEGAEYIY